MLAPILKQCQFCGKDFGRKYRQGLADFEEAKFCSIACYYGGKPSPQWGGLQDRLAALVEQGLSAAKISAEFGVSRSAVISRCNRTGLKLKGGPGGGYSGPRKPRLTIKPKKLRPSGPRNAAEDRLIPMEQRRSFMELDALSCRWPIGEGQNMFFCGAVSEEGRPYCGAHCLRAYRAD